MERFKSVNFYYTLGIMLVISLAAKYLAQVPALKLFGHLVIALVIGMALQTSKGLKEQIKADIPFISNKFLRLGIILLGFKLALDRLLAEGKKTLVVAFFIVLFMITLTYFMCRAFKVDHELALLSSCGSGICGAAAVMGVSGQLRAKTDNSVLAVAVVAILGTVFTLIEVTLQPYLGLDAYNYGVFTGGSLHEIAHAVAAGGEVRAFACTTKHLVEEARLHHDSMPVATAALGRLLSAGSMMGLMMKGENDRLTLQIKGDGPIGGLIVTADSKARVKGYVYNPDVELPLKSEGKLDVGAAVGSGVLTVIRDMGLKEPYVGRTNLITGEIAEDLTYYFASSEQVPSVVALGVLVDRDYSVKRAGGFIIQLMPGASDETIDAIEKKIPMVTSVTGMLDEDMTPEEILTFILEDLNVEITDKTETSFYCDCNKERVEQVLISIGEKELTSLYEEDKPVEVCCQFCGKKYEFSTEEIGNLLKCGK